MLTFSITLGWWLVPAVLTFIAFALAFWRSMPEGGAFGLSAVGDAVVALFCYGLALIASLLFWLAYFIALNVWA